MGRLSWIIGAIPGVSESGTERWKSESEGWDRRRARRHQSMRGAQPTVAGWLGDAGERP